MRPAIAHVAIGRSARPLPAIRIKHAGARRLSSEYRIVLTGREIDSGEQYVTEVVRVCSSVNLLH